MRFRKGRPKRSFKRRPEHRSPIESILVVCEGKKTEKNYFEALITYLQLRRTQLYDIRVEGQGAVPITVVEKAIVLRDSRQTEAASSPVVEPYDHVWCVFDTEAPDNRHESLNRAYDLATHESLKIALSNPCFEYWYLCHFKKHSAPFGNNRALLRELKKHIKRYKKGDRKTFDVIKDSMENAIENAIQVIKERQYGADLRSANPSTSVHILVRKLMDMKLG